MAYIVCRNLTLGYEGEAVAENISFKVNKGDYLCIVGENGTGKSTLMKTLLNLNSPIAGDIEIGDGLLPHEIGYLPQQTVVQKDFPATVQEIVLSGTLPGYGSRLFYSREQKKLANDNMGKMDISELKNRSYRKLSGGQQQRVLLARALCATSKLLLLDEPVTGLDPKATEEFYRLIASLNKEGISIIMISHDIEAALKYASHILHIDKKDSFYGKKFSYLDSKLYKNFNVPTCKHKHTAKCFDGGE
ncbi:MAG: ABC transporter ATP-binding protein [Lachnospiraceae bacterium]|nr:ABC transporter ATP-binding protein [Lachnospiraceae bacterium]